ncbi:hypothetical protein AFE_1311 [Acidithiobacillus ferrooxidans ATCC 23270]|uniref:Uncharacterized protein n=1 Tax=Acidithiobacillus ferrooxidans (strain ATCC 23270 / DSM 14882 / CIP 104768 / NCIMB 8455) TaxID=243159 RepID=B7J8Z3_ACIF2|nr:hypothetical protein [Acidithiobacillus ferrooxidans]ACK80781.1 hypothetical protein AFE_1311 [Acidithiobacillus ferrooxidans ATCC 23270]
MNIQTIDIAELEGLDDIALVVNGTKVATVDPDFEEDGSVSNMDNLAHALADVVGVRIRYVRINQNMEQFQADGDVEGSWTWNKIISAVWVTGKDHSPEFLRAQPGVTFIRTDGLSTILDPIELCHHNGVSLVQVQEPEIAGMWDWISGDGKNACDMSFSSMIEAARDAVKVLGLD